MSPKELDLRKAYGANLEMNSSEVNEITKRDCVIQTLVIIWTFDLRSGEDHRAAFTSVPKEETSLLQVHDQR